MFSINTLGSYWQSIEFSGFFLIGIDTGNFLLQSIISDSISSGIFYHHIGFFLILIGITLLFHSFFYTLGVFSEKYFSSSSKTFLSKYFVLWIFPLRYIPIIGLLSSSILGILRFGYWKSLGFIFLIILFNIFIFGNPFNSSLFYFELEKTILENIIFAINSPHFINSFYDFIFGLIIPIIDGSNFVIYAISSMLIEDFGKTQIGFIIKHLFYIFIHFILAKIFFYYIGTKISDKISESKKAFLNKYFILWIFPLSYIPVIGLFSSTILGILKFGYWKNIFLTLFLLIINTFILWPIIMKFFT